jgi:hypothetical protein
VAFPDSDTGLSFPDADLDRHSSQVFPRTFQLHVVVVLEHPRDSAADAHAIRENANRTLKAEGFLAPPPALGYRGSGFGRSFVLGRVPMPNIDIFRNGLEIRFA